MAIEIVLDPKNGVFCSDGNAQMFAEKYMEYINDSESKEGRFTCGTAPIFTWIRVFILQGKIDVNDVFFTFNGEPVEVNELGKVKEWPEGLFDSNLKALTNLLKGKK